tara:strand:+ start:10929 stop:12020 length:1092 start_codon:yes stop_codon:yes gene_type:complete
MSKGISEETSVLHCIATLGGGGAERQVRGLLPAIAGQGMRVGLMTRFAPGDREYFEDCGIDCVPLPQAGHNNPAVAAKVIARVARDPSWIVQTWLQQMDLLGGLGAQVSGAQWILSERSSALHYSPTTKNHIRRLLARRASLIIANSQKGLDYWSGLRVAQTIIANGIDVAPAAEFSPIDLVPSERPLLLAIGRLDAGKNMAAVIRAFAHYRREGGVARLAILGDGPDAYHLRKLARDEGLDDSVVFAGFRSDVPAWLARADAFVSFSRYEGQPNAVLEAAFARVPLLLSDIEEHREVIGDAAAYADADNPIAAATQLRDVLSGNARVKSRSDAAHALVSNRSFARIAALYVAAYENLLAGSR